MFTFHWWKFALGSLFHTPVPTANLRPMHRVYSGGKETRRRFIFLKTRTVKNEIKCGDNCSKILKLKKLTRHSAVAAGIVDCLNVRLCKHYYIIPAA